MPDGYKLKVKKVCKSCIRFETDDKKSPVTDVYVRNDWLATHGYTTGADIVLTVQVDKG